MRLNLLKRSKKYKIVVSGAVRQHYANLYVLLGVKSDNIIMFDKGVLSSTRTDLSLLLQKKYSKGKVGIQ
jgi:malate dehydrogenase (oxaloacetate-decarboxylating)(NADP+)